MLDITPAEIEKLQARIVVIGAGGAGCNAINNMIEKKLPGVQFVAMNTDTQSLGQSKAENKIQLGVETTEGLGAGSNPDVGRAAALESEQKIQTILKNAHMVFITAGMGGGTGTGSAPVIARLAREMGILTVGVVTKPFRFERKRRAEIANAGLDELQQFVDTLIVIPNENLFRLSDGPTTLNDAFSYADDVLLSGVRGVTDLIVKEGKINLDFNDIKTVMKEKGKAVMGTGEANGENRAHTAATQAINNPLLEDISLKGASSVLINITSGNDVTLRETDEAVNCVNNEVSEDALVIFGLTLDEDLGDTMRVSVIATGVDADMTDDNLAEERATVRAAERQAIPVVEIAQRSAPQTPAAQVAPQPAAPTVELVREETHTPSASVEADSEASLSPPPAEEVKRGGDYSLFSAEPRRPVQKEVREPSLGLDISPAPTPESTHISAPLSPLSELRRRSHQAPQGASPDQSDRPASSAESSASLPNFLRRDR